MAAKNGRNSSKDRDAGSAASAASGDDDAEIRGLIDGDGSGEADRESPNVGDSVDGNDSESRDSGSASAGSGDDSGSGAPGSGDSESGIFATRTAKSRRTRNRSRSTGRSSGSAASEETRRSRDDISRPIAPPKRPRIDVEPDEIPSTSAEIIGDSFQFIFWGIGQATGLSDEWDLDEDDARDIGRNGDKWLKSLGKKRAQNIVKNLNKIGPSLAFFGSIGMALVPRVRTTIQAAKNGAIRPIKARENRNGGNGSNRQSVAPSSAPVAGGADVSSSAGFREVPFAAKDFSEVTQGFAGTDDGPPVS